MFRRLLGRSKRFFFNMLDAPAVILLYHRVTTLESDPQLLSVQPHNFFEQVSLLKKEYTLLGVEDFADLIVNRKKLPANAVLITFDDGYADNYVEALPILESLSAQALFYIATENIDTDRELWWDELERILFNADFHLHKIQVTNGDDKITLQSATAEDRLQSYQFLHRLLKYSLPDKRENMMAALRKQAGLSDQGRASHRIMNKHEIRELARSVAAIVGTHTHRHPALSVLTYAQQMDEIEKSKTILKEITGGTIDHFSYPYGSKKDYDENTIKICREVEFKMVCSNYYGHVHNWTDRFQLPRILVRDWNKDTFKNKIQKFFTS
jgi:peptidoglycan/xylan/chitin deacetylase (PgdA/CDA1 family)